MNNIFFDTEETGEDISLKETDEVVNYYNNNITLIVQAVFESIEAYREEGLQDDLIIAAMKDAVFRNKRNWKYIDSILRDCRNNKVFTAEQFEIKQKEFKEQIKTNKSIQKQATKKDVVYNTDFSEYDNYAKQGNRKSG